MERRVGTFTLGIVLLAAGILFVVHIFVPALSYYNIFMLWPLVLILLGIEVLLSLLVKKPVSFKYDFAAILIVFMMVVFSMGMAVADYCMRSYELIRMIN